MRDSVLTFHRGFARYPSGLVGDSKYKFSVMFLSLRDTLQDARLPRVCPCEPNFYLNSTISADGIHMLGEFPLTL